MKKKVSAIQINSGTKEMISLANYRNLSGSIKENILCAIFVNICASINPITANDFLTLYNHLVKTLYQGIVIDFTIHPLLKDSSLFDDARSLKGDETENLINRESCIKIANLISCNNKPFAKELDQVFTDFEVGLLLFSFSPNCPV